MKKKPQIIVWCVAASVSLCLDGCENHAPSNEKRVVVETDTSKKAVVNLVTDTYDGLRDKAFKKTPAELGIHFPDDKAHVYGVVMDWENAGVVATTVSYSNGEADIHMSAGGGVIGGVEHKNVREAAKQFVALAQNFLDKATKTDATPLPPADGIKFYLITNQGIYSGSEQMKNFQNYTSPWQKLFDEGNKVIAELQKTIEK